MDALSISWLLCGAGGHYTGSDPILSLCSLCYLKEATSALGLSFSSVTATGKELPCYSKSGPQTSHMGVS